MDNEPERRLGRVARATLVLAGLLLIGAAGPVGFFAMVFSGGGHGSPFDGSVSEWIFGAAMLAIPVLMLLLGIACLASTTRKRLLVVGILAAAIPADLVVAVIAIRIASQPKPPSAYITPAPPPDSSNQAMIAGPQGRSIGIACSAETGECVTTEAGNGADSHSGATRIPVPGEL